MAIANWTELYPHVEVPEDPGDEPADETLKDEWRIKKALNEAAYLRYLDHVLAKSVDALTPFMIAGNPTAEQAISFVLGTERLQRGRAK